MADPKPPLASVLERTLLRPNVRAAELHAACDEAAAIGLGCLVVYPAHVAYARARLARGVRLCAAIGYPFGVDGAAAQRAAAEHAIAEGADEVEVVASIPLLVHDELVAVRDELRSIGAVCRSGVRSTPVRVVVDACYLSPGQLVLAAKAADSADAEMVVCSSGFGPQGATVEAVATLRRALPPEVLVKAQGGVRTLADAQRLRAAGAARVGVADAAAIISEAAEGRHTA